jgi:hypothetical protein
VKEAEQGVVCKTLLHREGVNMYGGDIAVNCSSFNNEGSSERSEIKQAEPKFRALIGVAVASCCIATAAAVYWLGNMYPRFKTWFFITRHYVPHAQPLNGWEEVEEITAETQGARSYRRG